MKNTEYELRILGIDVDEMKEKLRRAGATLVEEVYQRRYVYDFSPVDPNKWIRLRTNGSKSTLTIKQIESISVDGTKELEIEVSDFDTTNEMLEDLGYKARNYQENKRIRYDLNGVEVDIDFWPLIPAYLEIEGKSEGEVMEALSDLGCAQTDTTALGVMDIYREVYHINLLSIPILSFKGK